MNEVAGEHWSHERVGEPLFYMEDRLVHTVVKVSILNRSHMGEGFSKFQVDDQGRIINRHYAIRSATKDGVRDAISYFGIGKSFNDTVKINKAPDVEEHETLFENRTCIKCNISLSDDDRKELNRLKIKFDYCIDHIPKHFKK